ncbi:aquaporin 12 [Brienomyrus brachyistius]|uniref:aquaporin 12 n=1 Tax=Brienomyrus brachyistius TaxID=42636 RepID=UPI0020B229EA|nr:aquaporin 12 [Brienomyrus brachyistius]
MAGLNACLGFLLAAAALGASARALLGLRPGGRFSQELPASFVLVASRLETQTLMEVGQWAGGFGADVAATVLFVVLAVHGAVYRYATGNTCVTIMEYLLCREGALSVLASLAAHFLGAWLAQLFAQYYWSLELSDMHMIRNLMMQACSPTLRASVYQGAFTEGVCALGFHLLYLSTRRAPATFRVPVVALALAFLSYAASDYTSGLINPSLAYALTFHCPGFTLLEYTTVFWLAPLAGMAVALFLHCGHIPRLFSRNLLYSQKTRFRVPTEEKIKAGKVK